MLPLKGLRGRNVGERVTGWDGKALKELEGLPGGASMGGGHGRVVPNT